MRHSYFAAFLLSFILMFVSSLAQGQSTPFLEDFEDETLGTTDFVGESNSTWAGGIVVNTPVEAILGTQAYQVAPGDSGQVNNLFLVGLSGAVEIMHFVHPPDGNPGRLEFFADQGCTIPVGTTVQSVSWDADDTILESGVSGVQCMQFRAPPTNEVIVDDFFVDTFFPVELVSFEALADGPGVALHWQTASEANNAGFEIQWAPEKDHSEASLVWESLGFVEGVSTSSMPRRYHYRTEDLDAGVHRFRLRQVDLNGTFRLSSTVEVQLELPSTHTLSTFYPNPFNPATTFTLSVSKAQQVRIQVFDLLGRSVVLLHDGPLAGSEVYTFRFDAGHLSSGPYVVGVAGENFIAMQKVMFVK